jgi:ArsR family transcriptional regulator, virulence genes transcriptional regulator
MQERISPKARATSMRAATAKLPRKRNARRRPGVVASPGHGANSNIELAALIKQAAVAARLLKLLGSERRLLTLCFLAARHEMTVGELVGAVGLSQSALSQHLAKLRHDGLVAYRRESQTLHYRIADPRAARVLALLKKIYCGDLK